MLTAVLAGVVVGPSPAIADTSRGIEIPSFYTPPATLPAANGALIRSEPLPSRCRCRASTAPCPGLPPGSCTGPPTPAARPSR
ncbi:hypothetical protein [Paractinoplanes durhamensis]|uniref:hypothetical protein n=1 Tax=Paractinoplanes durhamensis TaxID=113563 RepID=UPI0036433A6D